ncbi:MAG TPA: T9SS type A sorting domain-containing protein, partial [Ferruginibacter sp.]|nr:T9SS type A sorting domain-containing protein [Ferruginibacter sp.]
TEINYVQNTTSPTGLNVAMAPAVTVSGDDANNNRDLDFVETIRITSTGTLAGTPVDVAAVAGLATFSTLTHTAIGTGLTLNAERTTTLDWDIVSNPFDIAIASAVTDYFRSVQTGNWGSTTTWESSPDNSAWIPATLTPTEVANNIYIRNGHTVTVSTALTADQIEIENGAVLLNSAGIFTINDGLGADVTIFPGGIFTLASAAVSPAFSAPSALVIIHPGAILRISKTGYTGNGTGMNANSFFYQDASIVEYTLTSAFSASGVTFFPNAGPADIPIFRTTAIIASAGGGMPTIFNGVFEANGAITFTGAGTKTFRNGITGTAPIVGSASGQFNITGATAILGGAGIITLPTTGGLQVGSTSTVTMTSGKSLVGDVTLLADSYINLGAFDLTVTGSVNGGAANSYIRTNGAGNLNLLNITALKTFPIGNSTYNPVTVNNVSGYNWSAKVEDVLAVIDPIFVGNVANAVQRTWTVLPSLNPPATATDITFQYDDSDPTQIGGTFNPALQVQIWFTGGSHWQSAGVPQTPAGPVPGVRTASLTAWSGGYPKFAISNDGSPLPITINYFNGYKQNADHSLHWKVTCTSTPTATMVMERSTDGRSYSSIYSITATALQCQSPFNYTDAQPAAGVNYYRLKMTDANGKVAYSGVVSLINAVKGFDIMNIAPNPIVSGRFNLNVSAAQKAQMNVVVTDMQGRVMQQQTISLIAGFNAIPMNVTKLSAGTYQVYGITEDGRSKVLRFVIQ